MPPLLPLLVFSILKKLVVVFHLFGHSSDGIRLYRKMILRDRVEGHLALCTADHIQKMASKLFFSWFDVFFCSALADERTNARFRKTECGCA